MNPFPARYHGLCFPCDQSIQQGDSIVNHPVHGYIHEDCQWDADSIAESDPEPRNRSSHTPVTMPRGKTARDRCERCFLIHSTGQVDCE
jgi:hypothetical protein